MRVKKIIASTMPEAMAIVRRELGSEAIILHSKEVRNKGFLGVFRKNKIEVVAGLDNELPIREESPAMKGVPSMASDSEGGKVLEEIQSLKKLLERSRADDFTKKYELAFQQIYEHLLDQEVSLPVAEEIMEAAIAHKSGAVDGKDALNSVRYAINERLAAISDPGIDEDRQVIQFVGPTGVGKTTTIAKIAAKLQLENKKRIAFITTDTYRIAAVEQLKVYARILNIPVEVAYSIDDYRRAVQKFSSFDFILVDTAGRNFRDPKYIKELKEEFDHESLQTYLVLSISTKQKDIQEVFEQFRKVSVRKVIFTKLDETKQYGSILNIALENNMKLAFLTDGQDVPDNLVPAEAEIISELLLGEYNET